MKPTTTISRRVALLGNRQGVAHGKIGLTLFCKRKYTPYSILLPPLPGGLYGPPGFFVLARANGVNLTRCTAKRDGFASGPAGSFLLEPFQFFPQVIDLLLRLIQAAAVIDGKITVSHFLFHGHLA
jgi:hypothetical protein